MSHERMQRNARELDVVQRERIALGNMEKALERMGLPDRTDIAGRREALEKVEAAIMNELRLQARSKKEGAEPWLQSVYRFKGDTLGLGDATLCVVGLLPSLDKFPNPAKLWRYCGLDPVDGKARRAKVGEKLGFSKRLRSYCIMRLVDPVIKCTESKYRAVYDARRAHTDVTHPEWSTENPKAPDMHSHRDAMRVTAKRILLDLWRAARGPSCSDAPHLDVPPVLPSLTENTGERSGPSSTDTQLPTAAPFTQRQKGGDHSPADSHWPLVASLAPRRRAARDPASRVTPISHVSPAADFTAEEVAHV